MANQVKIVFSADESAVLRSQKAIIAGEQKTADAMKQTARAAEQAERATTAAKNRAARSTNTGWVAGTHGVSPLVLDPSVMRARSAMADRVARSLAPRRVDLHSPELLAFDQTFKAEQTRRALLAARENRMLGASRFNGVDTTDFAAVQFDRFQRAQELRGRRALAASSRTAGIVADAHGEIVAERQDRIGRIDVAKKAAYDAKIAANRQADERTRQSAAGIVQGAAAIGASMAAIGVIVDSEMERLATTVTDAERSLAGVYGVGNNSTRRPIIRGEVIQSSIASGLPLGNVAELRGRMESAFEDMPVEAKRAAERASLQYSRLGVTDTTQTALGLGAAYQFYGKSLGGGANAMNTLANRLAYSADVGAFDPNQVTPYLADVLGTFSALGYKDSEAFGALAAASKSGMRAEKFSTALRNIPLTLTDAEAKGKFKRTGSFAGDMQAMARFTDAQLLDIVGRDAFPVVELMRGQLPQLQEYTRTLASLGPNSNVLGSKIGAGLAGDDMARVADVLGSASKIRENAPLMQMEDPVLAKSVTDLQLRKAGAALTTNPYLASTVGARAWFEGTDAHLAAKSMMNPIWGAYATYQRYLGGESDGYLMTGARAVINAKRQNKENFMADYLSLKYNPDRDQAYTDKSGNRILAGEAEAEQLRDFYKRGYTDLSAGELMQYLQMKDAGGDGQGYLDRVGRPKAGGQADQRPLIDRVEAAVDKFSAAVNQATTGGVFDAERR